MPAKPTKWRVRRPARSTRNSWKGEGRRKKEIHYFGSKSRTGSLAQYPAPLTCLPVNLSDHGDLSTGHQAAPSSAQVLPLWFLLLLSLITLLPTLTPLPPSLSSKVRTPPSVYLSSHHAFDALLCLLLQVSAQPSALPQPGYFSVLPSARNRPRQTHSPVPLTDTTVKTVFTTPAPMVA